MKKLCIIAISLLLLTNFNIELQAERQTKINEIMNLITKEKLENYLKNIISFGPRVTGSEECRETAKYIYECFSNFNLKTRYHDWSASANFKTYEGQNVEGVLEGDEKIIVFNAHFDSVANTVGADDNAAGVAALLAVAEAMSKFDFRHTIKFVAFSGEEQGLLGSNEYAREAYERGDEIIIEFNADMIGHAESKEGERKFRIYATEDADWIVERMEEINNATIGFELVKGNISRRYGGSDYHSFAKYGYESIAFFEYEWNPYMHQPADNFSNVNLNYLVNTTRLIAGIMAYLGDAEIEKPYLLLSEPKRGRIYFNGNEIYKLKNTATIIFGKALIEAKANSPYKIDKVEFYIDNKLLYTDYEAPYEYEMSGISFWRHEIKVIAYSGGKHSIDRMQIFWINFKPRQ